VLVDPVAVAIIETAPSWVERVFEDIPVLRDDADDVWIAGGTNNHIIDPQPIVIPTRGRPDYEPNVIRLTGAGRGGCLDAVDIDVCRCP